MVQYPYYLIGNDRQIDRLIVQGLKQQSLVIPSQKLDSA